MNREERNIGSIVVFLLVIVAIIVGGYFLINKNKPTESESNTQSTTETTKKSIKLDNSKNYIYYTNESVLSDEKDITYKDLNINIDSKDAKEIQDKFNNQMVEIKKNVTYDSNNKLVEAEVLEYSFTITSKYLSLTVSNYILGSDDEIKDSSMLYYVFDLSDGSLLTTKDLLSKENLSDQQIRSKIRSFLNNDEDVDIDATLNQEYSITFSSDSKVLINFLVKSTNKEYYTNIEM